MKVIGVVVGWLVLAPLALLAGCGGGAALPGSVSPTPVDYYPLHEGDSWNFVDDAGRATTTIEVIGSRFAGNAPGFAVQTRDSDGSTVSVQVPSADAVRQYAPADADPLTVGLSGSVLLRRGAAVGDRFLQADTLIDFGGDVDQDGRNEVAAMQAETVVLGFEAVTVPAGRFADCLHQQQVIRLNVRLSSGAPAVDLTLTVDTWYAAGVGPVKIVSSLRGRGVDDNQVESLQSWRVAPTQRDTTAPTLLAVTPADGQPLGPATAVVSATFSEAMAAASFTSANFRVLDASGHALAGRVQVDGNVARFVPDQPWADGSYRVELGASVQDGAGNALAEPRNWPLVVDGRAPQVLATTPAAGAQGVDPTAGLLLDLNEAPDPATLNAGTVRLTDCRGQLNFRSTVVGNRVTIMPDGPLSWACEVTLAVDGVQDRAGNLLAPLTLRFRTATGAFAAARELTPGTAAISMAVGDVDGDGLPDVVSAPSSTFDFSYRRTLLVYAGRSDGNLALPQRVDSGSRIDGDFEALAIGDLDGDGRADVVAATNFRGIQVLHQRAGGTLVADEYLETTISRRLRLADLDRDGRLDLVAIGGDADRLEIWRQDSKGRLQRTQSISVGVNYTVDIEVGDVNGDGRPDLLVAVEGGPDQHIAVLLQRADGSFAAPTFLSTGSPWRATALALGDVNGDGRIDLVATTGGNSPTYIAVFPGLAGGGFGSPLRVPSFDAPTAVRVADFDGDGRADIVVSHNGWGTVSLHLQTAAGSLAAEQRYPAPANGFNPNVMAIGDVDGNGRVDVLIGGAVLQNTTAPPRAGGLFGRAWRAASGR